MFFVETGQCLVSNFIYDLADGKDKAVLLCLYGLADEKDKAVLLCLYGLADEKDKAVPCLYGFTKT